MQNITTIDPSINKRESRSNTVSLGLYSLNKITRNTAVDKLKTTHESVSIFEKDDGTIKVNVSILYCFDVIQMKYREPPRYLNPNLGLPQRLSLTPAY